MDDLVAHSALLLQALQDGVAGDISLNAAAVWAVGLLLSSIASGMGFLYLNGRGREKELTTLLVEEMRERARREKELSDQLLPAVQTQNQVLRELTSAVTSLQLEMLSIKTLLNAPPRRQE